MFAKVNETNFKDVVENNDKAVLVDFYADWCGPCEMQEPILKNVAKQHDAVDIVKLNVDDNASLIKRFDIRSIPMLLLFKDGQLVDSLRGLSKEVEINQLLEANV
jgi:thioredoxin 1